MSGLPHEAYLACMAGLPSVGPATLRRLAALGPVERTWARLRSGRIPGSVLSGSPSGVDLVARWSQVARGVDPAQRWAELRSAGVGVTSLGSPGFPDALRSDPDPPVLLFHLGDPGVLVAPRVAIIGTRRPTGYGVRIAHRLASGLASSGVCVVSGLALGIDAAAHAGAVGALDGGGAPPVAVVGSGLDAPCPQPNRALARRVAACGMVCSEVPVGVPAAPWRFPVRNRIIAAFADVVVVVESAVTGGSMSTVEHALSRNRTVLAVPGPVDAASSEGTNRLIADGAGTCTGVDDVLAHLDPGRVVAAARPSGPPANPRPLPGGLAGRLLELLGWRPETVDHLIRASGADPRAFAVALDALADSGWVVRRDGFVERCPTQRSGGR